MKKILLLSCWILFSGFMPVNPPNNDYIKTGYYQLIYEADIAYLSGDKELAYQKISQAEKLCPLIQQPMYVEISDYIELLCERNYFEKAIQYITLLVGDYGYPPEQFENADYFPSLSAHTDWDGLKQQLTDLSNKFYSKVDTLLVKELKTITKNDQIVRKREKNQTEEEFKRQVHATDTIHEARIKEIFASYGYPNQRLIGYKNTLWWSGIAALLMHFDDTTYFPKVLLDFIEKGECSPSVLGSFVDSNCRSKSNKDRFIYGVYSNIGDEEIWDVANLDKRRQAIGMPTRKMQQQRDSLIEIKYGL